jgi:ectoine hydroxylase-related dioxygenase (phytanoyl-CoA dioxygenase family)
MLTEEQKQSYEENGFLRVPAVFDADDLEQMSTEMEWIFDTWADHDAAWQGPWRETYMDDSQRASAKLVAINDLHSRIWSGFASDSRLVDAVSDLVGDDVELHHTTLHAKPPEVGSPFPLHQDNAFFAHADSGYVDTIIHLDASPEEAGCLRFVPGSHKKGPLEHIRDGAPHLPTDQYTLADTVPVPAEAGDVVLFHLWTIHGSDLNRSNSWRRAVRLGYRNPANRQLDGHALGRFGWMVKGRRPRVDATLELKR